MNPSLRPKRAAFLLNANAKSVTKHLIKRLKKLIPHDDLYISSHIAEAEEHISLILNRGYAYIFCGGGDGTAVLSMNLLHAYAKNHPHYSMPSMGVLRLGTGNALGRFLGANAPEEDIKAILSGKPIRPVAVSMIENSAGQLTPFAGIGYDGELMNDFETVKEVFFESPFRKFFTSVLGFTIAGFTKTLPRQISRVFPTIRVNSSYPAYRIEAVNGVDEETFIEQGELLYNEKASLICVGTIPTVGYGLTMFPFSVKRPGYMHLRISAVPLPVCLSHLYPSIWHGHFRHKKLFDYLVKDVTIESEESLPYHFGGDAMGYKKQLYFRVAKNPVVMATMAVTHNEVTLPPEPLLMPLM